MIVIDTNIISELMKSTPSLGVLSWFEHQDNTQLFVSTITLAEISYGLNALPPGQRRSFLEAAFDRAIRVAFGQRILPFCVASAHRYGNIMAARKSLGRPLGVPDGQIAAITSVHGAVLATRNTKDFENCGLKMVNPFED